MLRKYADNRQTIEYRKENYNIISNERFLKGIGKVFAALR